MKAPVVLVHPPQAKACEPPAGILALAGHLERVGGTVRVVDANLLVQQSLVARGTLEDCAVEMERRGAPRAHLTSAQRCARGAPKAWSALARPSAYADPVAYRAALDDLGEAFRAVSRARGFRLSLSDLDHPRLSPLSARDLASVADEPDLLPLSRELAAAAGEILRNDPGLIGISATYLSQALPTFGLAGSLRRAGYRHRLVLGGALLTSWARALRPTSPFFRVWDAVVVGPGEDALTALPLGKEISSLTGVLAPQLGIWNPPDCSVSRTVCFDPSLAEVDLPWDRYLAPGPVLPLTTSRGCYWRRCTFCPEAAQDRQPFHRAPTASLLHAVLSARDRLGTSWVHLTDDAVPPAGLRALARNLRGEGVSWYGFARLEPDLLDPGFALELAEGGCAMLQLGVETASQRLLDLMGKGTRAADAGPILRNLTGAGIRTYVYLLFGFPTETPEESRNTVAWASSHAESITFLNLSLLSQPRQGDGWAETDGQLSDAPSEHDLSLYRLGDAGTGERRRRSRSVLSEARSVPAIRTILVRSPPGFTSNHAPFAPLAV